MQIMDPRGKNILKGVQVRYTGTGTAGEVLDVREDPEGKWAKMDSTAMWYNTRFLEVLKPEEYQRVKRRETLKERVKSAEEVDKEAVARKTMESMKKKIGEDVDMSNELCDGGG